MFFLLVYIIAILMFVYGIKIIRKKEIRVGIGNNSVLKGKKAKLIGFLYLLATPTVYINLAIFETYLSLNYYSFVDVNRTYDIGYTIIYIGTLAIFLIIILALSKKHYEIQELELNQNP